MPTGGPFDGSGIGRAWPLLVGERGHLALQAGEESLSYLQTMWNCASHGGLLPEQVWDAAADPRRWDSRQDGHRGARCRCCGHTPSS